MPIKLSREYRDVVIEVAGKTGVPPELMIELLDLEPDHQNLHGWGARPALRRAITTIIDRALEQKFENLK